MPSPEQISSKREGKNLSGGTVVFLDTGQSDVMAGKCQSRIGREDLGAQWVAACCEEVGWRVRYLRPDTRDPEIAAQKVQEGECDVLVFFPYTYTKWLADAIAAKFKGKLPIIYGGCDASFRSGEILGEGLADYVISGRGERVLPNLLKTLESERLPRQMIFSTCANNSGNYPLDAFPWPIRQVELMQDLELEPLPFMPPASLESNPCRATVIFGSIGCMGRCDYCNSWKIAPKPLYRSPQNVIREMIWLREQYGPLVYFFADPLFNANPGWALALLRLMAERGPFASLVMCDFRINKELVLAMKKAGVYKVMMGLEFVNSGLRQHRGKRAGDPRDAFELCYDAGLITQAFYMIGRLGMTRQDFLQEQRAVESLPYRSGRWRMNFEVPFVGTGVSDSLAPGDIIAPESHWTTEEVVYRTGCSPEEWQKLRREANASYHLGPEQVAYYDHHTEMYPELGPVYEGFIKRLREDLEK